MVKREIRLAWGAATLFVAYVCLNVFYRMLIPKLFPVPPASRELVDKGQSLVEGCTACHYLDQPADFIGPQLMGLIGRPVADSSHYSYSPALRQLGGVWTPDRLSEFLSNPQAFAPGTKMSVTGWSQDDVKAIVAYLRSQD
jgi:cytochrome c2